MQELIAPHLARNRRVHFEQIRVIEAIGVQAIEHLQIARIKGLADPHRIIAIGPDVVEYGLPGLERGLAGVPGHVFHGVEKNHRLAPIAQEVGVIAVGLQDILQLIDDILSAPETFAEGLEVDSGLEIGALCRREELGEIGISVVARTPPGGDKTVDAMLLRPVDVPGDGLHVIGAVGNERVILKNRARPGIEIIPGVIESQNQPGQDIRLGQRATSCEMGVSYREGKGIRGITWFVKEIGPGGDGGSGR